MVIFNSYVSLPEGNSQYKYKTIILNSVIDPSVSR